MAFKAAQPYPSEKGISMKHLICAFIFLGLIYPSLSLSRWKIALNKSFPPFTYVENNEFKGVYTEKLWEPLSRKGLPGKES